MWEISSGQLPFINHEHNYDLAMKIINGMRPKILSGTPLEYKKLMEQCWDADPNERPDANTLRKEIKKLLLHFQNENGQMVSNQEFSTLYRSNSFDSVSKDYTSNIYKFENFPEPKNATEGIYLIILYIFFKYNPFLFINKYNILISIFKFK